MSEDRKVVQETFFERIEVEKNGKTGHEWIWYSRAMNGEKTATGDQQYQNINDALNGFLSQQGYPAWLPGEMLPEGLSPFIQHDDSGNVFRIETYERGNN